MEQAVTSLTQRKISFFRTDIKDRFMKASGIGMACIIGGMVHLNTQTTNCP